MKKIIYFIFAFLMSFSLFSCSDDEDISEIKKDAKADFLRFQIHGKSLLNIRFHIRILETAFCLTLRSLMEACLLRGMEIPSC